MRRQHQMWMQGTLTLVMLAAPGMTANPTTAARELERIGAGTERVSAEVAPKVVQILIRSVKVAGAGDEQPNGVLISERGRGSGIARWQ